MIKNSIIGIIFIKDQSMAIFSNFIHLIILLLLVFICISFKELPINCMVIFSFVLNFDNTG